ncbi:MAG TPA: metallophosphoesterase family protein [Thermodesulfobacteriota bacterium]|nr:metallophosphoesterase family protein [Thermodesulfobacteriota bacterium]
MRFAIVSDLHANLEALEAVLARIEACGVDEIVCLGDIVGYNARPNEVVAEVRRRRIRCVQGNHDAMAACDEPPLGFGPLARGAILWTRRVLAPEHRLFLGQLPLRQPIGARGVGVHGAPSDRDRYILSAADAAEEFAVMAAELPGTSVVFFGHTHIPVVFRQERGWVSAIWSSRSEPGGTGTVALEPEGRYLVNPGGVGQPRDGLPTAPFAIYDEGAGTVRFERVPYDVEACAAAVRAAGLDPRLAQRLYQGW